MCRVREEFTAGFCRFCNVKSAMKDDILQCYEADYYRPFYDKGSVRDPLTQCDYADNDRVGFGGFSDIPPALPTFSILSGELPGPCIRCYGEEYRAVFLDKHENNMDIQFRRYLHDVPERWADLENQDWHARPYLNVDLIEEIWPEDNEGHTYQGPLPELQDERIMLDQHIYRSGGPEHVDDEINERLAQWDNGPDLPTIDDCFYQRPWNAEPVLDMARVAAHRRRLDEEAEAAAYDAANPISGEVVDFLDEADMPHGDPERHHQPWR